MSGSKKPKNELYVKSPRVQAMVDRAIERSRKAREQGASGAPVTGASAPTA